MPIVIQEKFKNTNKKKQSKGGGGMDIGSSKKTTKKMKNGGKVPMPKPAPKTNVFTGNRKKDVNQAKAESMSKKGRRAGPVEKGLMGAGLAFLSRGRAGTGAALTGAKEIGKRIVKTASSLQVKEKMYQGSSEAWKKYEEQLKPLINTLDYYQEKI